MDFLQEQLIDPLSNVLNTHVLIYLLIGVGIYFTVRTRFIQIRYFGRMFRQLRRSHRQDGGISSFQAFCVGLASRVGTGNIAGVAIALTVGGPGAIFWMWVVAAVGMATALIEATLGQIFKVRSDDGAFRGGPAFYIQTRAALADRRRRLRRAADGHLLDRVQHGGDQRDQRRVEVVARHRHPLDDSGSGGAGGAGAIRRGAQGRRVRRNGASGGGGALHAAGAGDRGGQHHRAAGR